MIYNSNTGAQQYRNDNFQESSRRISSGGAGTSSQYGYDVWSMSASQRAKNIIYERSNATFDPYKGHLSILKSPNVNYGPLEDPTFIDPGQRGLNKYADSISNIRYIVKVADPLGRSTDVARTDTSVYRNFGGETSLLQIQQTMAEIKNRAQVETTRSYNRNVPPASRINSVTSVESIMERVLPDVMNSAKTTIIRPTRVALPLAASPHMSSGSYYNLVTGKIEGWQQKATERAFAGKVGPPELIEDFLEENTLWKKNTYHGADYKESPSTKDTTKETIKTIKATGEMVTTEIGDKSFTKNKEYERANVEEEKKQAGLEEKMKKKRQEGFLLGMNK